MWLRAVLTPALPVGAVVAVCLILGVRRASDLNDVAWGFWGVPAAGLLGLLVAALATPRTTLAPGRRPALAGAALAATVVAVVLGWIGWLQAAEWACHDRYECPF